MFLMSLHTRNTLDIYRSGRRLLVESRNSRFAEAISFEIFLLAGWAAGNIKIDRIVKTYKDRLI